MKTLRLFTLAFVLLLLANTGKAQWVSIPDTAFGNWLNYNGYTQCLQGDSVIGWELDTTCNKVTQNAALNVALSGINDLTGVQYFDNLESLICDDNNLTSLPPLPAGLELLYCRNNPLTNLPTLPASLKYLTCTNLNLSSLPQLPTGLLSLICSENNLSALPQLPATLITLECYSNPLLNSLPTLPNSLKRVYANYCNISALPVLPNNLEFLACGYNAITTLPALPNTLGTLACQSNPITTLPVLPNALNALAVQHCNLIALPALPDSLEIIYLNDNPQLSCLPRLPDTLVELRFNNTAITCLPNHPQITFSSNPPLSLIPACGASNPNGCAGNSNISGTVYIDANGNCLQDNGELVTYGVDAQLWHTGSLVQTVKVHTQGLYSFDVNNYATYQVSIDTSNIPFSVVCPTGGSLTSVISVADSLDYNMNFALKCKPGFDLEARSVFGNVFRPANYTYVHVAAGDATNFYNAHCAAGVSGSVTLSFTGPVTYISPAVGALAPTLSGNTITWNIADFGNVNFLTDFDVVMTTDTFAQIGQQACFTVTVNPIVNDKNQANNTLNICFPIVNSYDPNDKQAYPAEEIDTLQEELTYTVRFQNTGNAEAQHIYITDTLDANVRPETFELLAYSHQPGVQIDGRAVRFNFPNINLPDSFTNEPASHGYVQYKVKLKENLPIGTTINNTAFIYFDFNAPVITNTTTNTVALVVDTTVGIRPVKTTAEVFVYPNPASNMVTITVSENMHHATITITDMLGRKAIEPVTLNNTQTTTLNTQHLPDDVYMVNVKSANGTGVTKRLVVSR